MDLLTTEEGLDFKIPDLPTVIVDTEALLRGKLLMKVLVPLLEPENIVFFLVILNLDCL